jgi:hypothetical protein
MYSGSVETGALAGSVSEYGYSSTKQYIFGGTLTNRKDVPQEELDKIITQVS